MKLSDCLLKNHFLLGPNYEKLGKARGSSCLSGKILLSYTHKDGWKVLELNIFQLFFRKILGAYKSTHLNHIAKRINKLQLTDNIKDCHARIEALWTKKNLIGLGNGNLSEAGIICFAEKHGDKCYRASIAQLINASYREGDIILVEGSEASQKIASEDHQQTENLKPGCIVRGWEPENYEEINGSSFKKASMRYDELQKLCNYFQDNLRMEGTLTDEEITLLKIRLNELIEKIRDLNRYYKSKSKIVLQADKILEEGFEKLKKGDLSSEGNHGEVLYCIILEILVELEKNQEGALHKNMTSNEIAEIMNGVSLRNASLINEINKYRREGRKVFVIAGASHLLEFPNPYRSCKEVKESLHKNKFIVITRKDNFTKKIAQLNSDLKYFQFFDY